MMWTLEQVAKELQVEPRTVRKMCAAGEIEFVKLGRKTLRIKPEWVDAFIKRKQGRGDGKVDGRRGAARQDLVDSRGARG
jgi:excisionase family DNA binding protein